MSRPRPVADYPVEPNFSTHVFKVIHGVEITLRIWPGDPLPGNRPGPWILYAHGGAWGFGKNQLPNAWFVPGFRPRGYHFVGIGYRKTPQVWMGEILEDAMDAFNWCRTHLGELLGEEKIDINRYVLAGESAGAYIALMLAAKLSGKENQTIPRPRAVVSCYAPTDLVQGLGTGCEALGWWPSGEFTQQEIDEHVSDQDPAHAIALCPEEYNLDVEVLQEQWQDPTVVFTPRLRLQYETTKYLTTSGNLMEVVLRTKQFSNNPEEDIRHRKLFSPLYLIDQLDWFPPTYFFNGLLDAAVRYDVHLLPFREKLLAKGVPTLISLHQEDGHGFDNKFVSKSSPSWERYVVPALKFVEEFTYKD
ncbi:hypothetical protein V866_006914 [Kwoniella sp. B9012]